MKLENRFVRKWVPKNPKPIKEDMYDFVHRWSKRGKGSNETELKLAKWRALRRNPEIIKSYLRELERLAKEGSIYEFEDNYTCKNVIAEVKEGVVEAERSILKESVVVRKHSAKKYCGEKKLMTYIYRLKNIPIKGKRWIHPEYAYNCVLCDQTFARRKEGGSSFCCKLHETVYCLECEKDFRDYKNAKIGTVERAEGRYALYCIGCGWKKKQGE